LVPCLTCDDCQKGNYSLCKQYSFIGSREHGSFAEYVKNYSYENGNFSAINLSYKNDKKTLTFGKACGAFQYQQNFKIKLIVSKDISETINFEYMGQEETITFEHI
jgi:alpha-D-xyloside xylohydrolase